MRVTVTNIPSFQDAGCEDRAEKRNSDLCAQWKAADAATSAANYAWWALIFSAVGTFFLYITFREGRRTSRAELRAYVLLNTAQVHLFTEEGAPPAKQNHPQQRYVRVKITNFGNTPAHKLTFKAVTLVANYPTREFDPFPEDMAVSVGDLAQGRDRTLRLEVYGSGANHDALVAGTRAIYCIAEVRYEDIFGRHHTTKMRLLCSGSGYATGAMSAAEEGNYSD